ncbi:hypothetical protein [Streptomyces sp. Iso 434]|uniref:hypothetical protein n=1 Tax=Streptomyces sp. Iso 434 TaxID=3062272 RepID=UPI0039800682
MADYRAEAIEVYEKTSSSDTRGIIAALLYLAEGNVPASTTSESPSTLGSPGWKGAALSYLRSGYSRTKTAERIRQWLASEGQDVDIEEVKRGLWELVEAGHVKANTAAKPTQFSAAPAQR